MLWATENLLGTWRAGMPYGDRNGPRTDVYISALHDMVSMQTVGKYRVEMRWWRIRSGRP